MRMYELILALVGILIPPASWALPSNLGYSWHKQLLQQHDESNNIPSLEKILDDVKLTQDIIFIVEDESPRLESLVEEIQTTKKGLSLKGRKSAGFFVRKYDLNQALIRLSKKPILKPRDKQLLLVGLKQIVISWEANVRSHLRNMEASRRALAIHIAWSKKGDQEAKRLLEDTDRAFKKSFKLAKSLAGYAKQLR